MRVNQQVGFLISNSTFNSTWISQHFRKMKHRFRMF